MAPRGYVVLIGGLVAFVGYSLTWYGWLFLQGYSGPARSGPGLIDLTVPSRLCKVRNMLASGPPSGGGGGTPGPGSSGPPPPGGGQVGQVPGGGIIPPGGLGGNRAGTPGQGYQNV